MDQKRLADRFSLLFATLNFWLCFTCQPLPAQINPDVTPSSTQAVPSHKLRVLILGDSLSLCGFGKRLDILFRRDRDISAVYTYMACATVPGSWLKKGSYANAKTFCGYWSISSADGQNKPSEFVDGYERGHVPKPYLVPKLETLLSTTHPDILVMQSGTNLFGIFRDGKTVQPQVQGPILKNLVEPFLQTATTAPSPLRRIYWIGPPISGGVGNEVQQFLFDQLNRLTENRAVLIDSRDLVPYPYHTMARDHEHFFGKQMDQWADAVFWRIRDDLDSTQLDSLPKLSDSLTPVSNQATVTENDPRGRLMVRAQLTFRSKPLEVPQLLPYQESLVAFVYRIEQVVTGTYAAKDILVLHPAHIALKPQPLDKYVIGKSFLLQLDPIDATAWTTTKTSDETGRIDLIPYIQQADEGRLPSRGN